MVVPLEMMMDLSLGEKEVKEKVVQEMRGRRMMNRIQGVSFLAILMGGEEEVFLTLIFFYDMKLLGLLLLLLYI